MTPDELKHRTKTFAVEIFKFARSFRTMSPAHHLRTAGAKRHSRRIELPRVVPREVAGGLRLEDDHVEEEADETLFWLEVLVDTDTVPRKTVATLMDEAEQLLRIVVASITTARGGSRREANC